MLVFLLFTGLGCGFLLATIGVTIWGHLGTLSGLSRPLQMSTWLAGGLLVVGAMAAWRLDPGLTMSVSRLVIMAALAVPVGLRPGRTPAWGDAALALPALLLAGGGLFLPFEPQVSSALHTLSFPLLAIVFCGGLGARVLGEVLRTAIGLLGATEEGHDRLGGTLLVLYGLLTLSVSGVALANLWRLGVLWGRTSQEGGLLAAWLGLSAARVGRGAGARWRIWVVSGAVLLLLAAVLG